MKTQIIKSFKTLIVLVCLAASFKSAAQSCNYSVVNNLPCTIVVTVDYFATCTGTPCDSQSFSIAPGATQPVTCGGSCSGTSTLCNIRVTINLVAGNPMPSTTYVDINNTPSGPFTISGCSGITSINMSWAPTMAVIN